MPAKNRTCAKCPASIYADNRTGLCAKCRYATEPVTLDSYEGRAKTLHEDRAKLKLQAEASGLRGKYKEALGTIDLLEKEISAITALREPVETVKIEPKQGSGTSEGTVCALLSDWHLEEEVKGPEVSGLNIYNLGIMEASIVQLWQGLIRLTRLLAQDIRIDNMVIGLLGDFITGQIHDAENAEKNQLTPNHAIVKAQRLIISGIDFVLNHFAGQLTIVCHSGNHARTTRTTRFGAENGHSLEYLMYLFLEDHYRNEPRVTFIIPDGMHSYVDVYGQTIRFQHGHAIKYGGGVGGIYIPVNKAIAQWNKGRRADLDCFGHFHQERDGGNFLCNGSVIGYNSFALSIKADYEPPKQTLFLMDKKRGRTCKWPILFKDRTKK